MRKAIQLIKGRTRVDFPELMGPTIIGTLVVFAGPVTRMFLRATASSTRDKDMELAAKNAAAAWL